MTLAGEAAIPHSYTKRDLRFFMENGSPRWLRIYSNKGTENETVDCYTAVFTGRWRGRDGVHCFLALNDRPFHPQGFCQHGEITPAQLARGQWAVDRPKYAHLGRKIGFFEISAAAQQAILDDYMTLWRAGPYWKIDENDDEAVWKAAGEAWWWWIDVVLKQAYIGKPPARCPVCGEMVRIANVAKDARLVGSCGDAFTVQKWRAP